MTATGDHDVAAASYARLAQWMLWILLPLVAVMSLAGGTILLIYGPAFQQGSVWLGIVALASAINAFVGIGRNRNHGATAALEPAALFGHLRRRYYRR